MTRQTSIDAYNTIKNNGLLSERRWQVYDALYKYGPCTCSELFKFMKIQNHGANPAIHVRLRELERAGCITEIGTRLCAITGMTVIDWDVTSDLPVKVEPPLTVKQIVTAALDFIKVKGLETEFYNQLDKE